MQPATVTLNEALIRLAKGMITAWEAWLKALKGTEQTQKP